MTPSWFEFAHVLFAFAYGGALFAAEWNIRFARRTQDWNERAAHFAVVKTTTQVVAVPSLLVLAFFGNALAIVGGRSFAKDPWLHAANGLWALKLFVLLAVARPAAARLEKIARAAGADAHAADWSRALARARFANVALSVLLLVALWWMTVGYHA